MMSDDIEINDLISRLLAGEASPGEAMQLEDWKAASVVNKTYFDSAAKIFASNKMDEAKTSQQAWFKIKAEINRKESSGKIITLKWRKLNIAASVIFLIGIGILFKYSNTKAPEVPGTTVYKTDSSRQKIQLRDGSGIVLATNSSITLDKDFGKTNRGISLTGSAFFSVKHDSSMPFVINMNQLHVKDVGTKFYITSKADTVFVTMEEGEVLAYDDFGAKQSLIANDKAWYVKSARKFEFYTDTLTPKGLPKNKLSNKKKGGKKLRHSGKKIDSTNADEIKGPVKVNN